MIDMSQKTCDLTALSELDRFKAIRTELSVKWVERQTALALKGKKAENAMFEYFMGAHVALGAIGWQREADYIGRLTCMVLNCNPFPCAVVTKWAEWTQDDTDA